MVRFSGLPITLNRSLQPWVVSGNRASCGTPVACAGLRFSPTMRELWEEIMRTRMGLLGLALLAFGVGNATAAEPVKIRVAWVAPVSNWISIWLDKKDLAQHFG